MFQEVSKITQYRLKIMIFLFHIYTSLFLLSRSHDLVQDFYMYAPTHEERRKMCWTMALVSLNYLEVSLDCLKICLPE
jgi:hypothetical protein